MNLKRFRLWGDVYKRQGAEYEQIGSFRGASLEAETWNPLIASSVNDNLLSVIIDNKQYTKDVYKRQYQCADSDYRRLGKRTCTYE